MERETERERQGDSEREKYIEKVAHFAMCYAFSYGAGLHWPSSLPLHRRAGPWIFQRGRCVVCIQFLLLHIASELTCPVHPQTARPLKVDVADFCSTPGKICGFLISDIYALMLN